MITPRRVCAFSGKRGGFGAYVPLMRRLQDDAGFDLLILLGDMHASAAFGRTVDEARARFPAAEIELIDMGAGRGDSSLVRVENLATCLAETGQVLERWRPDIVLVHGDRAEHLVVALAALTLGVVVAHTQGGDRSGNIDELQRHAITKLAHLHFPESEEAAERLARLGEDPWRIHLVGSTYVDRIVGGDYVAPTEARRRLGLGEREPFLLAVVHPETFLGRDANRRQAETVFAAAAATGRRIVATYPCSDPGYEDVLEVLRRYDDDDRFVIRPNIDNDVYLGLMATADAMVGNSSAALVEAPYLRLPAVDVGMRQAGRARDANVIGAAAEAGAVEAALANALDPGFRVGLATGTRLGDGRASERIVEVLRAVELDDDLRQKQIAY